MLTVATLVDRVNGRGHISRQEAMREALESFSGSLVRVSTTEEDPDIMIIDDYRVCRQALEEWSRDGFLVVFDDYQPERIPDNCGLVVSSGYCDRGLYPCDALTGPDYAPVRRVFFDHPWDDSGHEDFDTRTVSDLSAVQIAEKMQHAGLVITNGGQATIEAACVGAPVVIDAVGADECVSRHASMAWGWDGHKVDGRGAGRIWSEILRRVK